MVHKWRDYQKLEVWHRSHTLTLDIYRVTQHFPREELFGLTSQSRRAAASIPANIAEGCGRGGEKELARFLAIAAGSANELHYHLILAADLELLDVATSEQLRNEAQQVSRMLRAYITRLR
jgi:four helix bundle protein